MTPTKHPRQQGDIGNLLTKTAAQTTGAQKVRRMRRYIQLASQNLPNAPQISLPLGQGAA